MARLKSERIILRENGSRETYLDFKIEINVTQYGGFTTYLPENIVEIFERCGMPMSSNGRRNGRKGYFEAPSLDSLKKKVEDCCRNYNSRTLIEERQVIQYVIETGCNYLAVDGEYYPNGNQAAAGSGLEYGRDFNWAHGTIDSHAASPVPHGFRIWTEVAIRREYSYLRRSNVIEYEMMHDDDFDCKKNKNLHWLAGVVSIRKPHGEVKEIEATEEIAAFFVTLHKALFAINERVQMFIEPEAIRQLVANNQPLLT